MALRNVYKKIKGIKVKVVSTHLKLMLSAAYAENAIRKGLDNYHAKLNSTWQIIRRQFFFSTDPYEFTHNVLLVTKLIIGIILDVDNGKSPPIVTEENMKLLFDIQKKIHAIRANYFGSMVSLPDICMKPLGTKCATQSILQYFKMDRNNFDSYGGIEHVEYCFQDEILSMVKAKNLTLAFSSESFGEEELKRESTTDDILSW